MLINEFVYQDGDAIGEYILNRIYEDHLELYDAQSGVALTIALE